MAKRINLREFQERVFSRLRDVSASSTGSTARLGVMVGAQPVLIDMRDVSEVVPATKLLDVPLVKPWFLGATNIRGNLYSVTDVQEFSGGGLTISTSLNRLLLVHPRWIHNAALLVDSMLGLRYAEQFRQLPLPAGLPVWITGVYEDGEGRHWQELNVGLLVQSPEFLKVGVFE